MTPEQQSAADKQVVNIHFVANGYIVGYPGERRVYRDEKNMLDEITAYIQAYRSSRPHRAGVPSCPTTRKEESHL